MISYYSQINCAQGVKWRVPDVSLVEGLFPLLSGEDMFLVAVVVVCCRVVFVDSCVVTSFEPEHTQTRRDSERV